MDPEDFVDVTPGYIKDYRSYIEQTDLPYVELERIIPESSDDQIKSVDLSRTKNVNKKTKRELTSEKLDSVGITEETKSEFEKLASDFNSEPKYTSVLLVGAEGTGKLTVAKYLAEEIDGNYKEFSANKDNLVGSLFDALLDEDVNSVVLDEIEKLEESQITDLIRCAKGKKLPIKIGQGTGSRNLSIKPEETFFIATVNHKDDQSEALKEIFDHLFYLGNHS